MKGRLGAHFSDFVDAALKCSKPRFIEAFKAPQCVGALGGAPCPFENVIELCVNEAEIDHL